MHKRVKWKAFSAVEVNPVSKTEFTQLIDDLNIKINDHIALCISGGADSLCLGLLLDKYCQDSNKRLTLLTVDHDLRDDSKAEADQVSNWLPHLMHHILKWDHDGVTSNIQDQARRARYDLIEKWCHENQVTQIFLGHHGDDQAENFLIRLERGSGLAGLSGMNACEIKNGFTYLRPLLTLEKSRLIQTLKSMNQEWIEDPSNQNENFLRIKMRKLLADHPEELPQQRILLATKNLKRAHDAIEFYVNDFLQKHTAETKDTVSMHLPSFLNLPDEVAYRTLSHILMHIGQKEYTPRLHSLETIFNHFKTGNETTKTLHDCLIAKSGDQLIFSKEKQL